MAELPIIQLASLLPHNNKQIKQISRTCSGFLFDMSYIENKIKTKLGSNCFIVKIIDAGTDDWKRDSAIISDGEYEYRISINRFNIKRLQPRLMTHESRIKYFNSFCIEDVVVVDECEREEHGRVCLKMRYIPNGHEETKSVATDKIAARCRELKLNATKETWFVDKLKARWGDRYDFSKTKYTNYDEKIIVTCKIHGDFEVIATSFLNNNIHGCKMCAKEISSGWGSSGIANRCKDNIAYLYLIECWNETERFIKIGVTSHDDVKKRFKSNGDLKYMYKEIIFITDDLNNILFIEQRSHNLLFENRYTPKIKFGGCTECFSIDSKGYAISIIKDLLLSSHIVTENFS